MDATLLAVPPSGESILNRLPGVVVHERWMVAVVGDTAVGHEPLVVRAPKDAIEVADRDRFRRTPAWRVCGEATFCELVDQIAHRPVSGCVGLERPADEWAAFGVDGNSANLSPIDHLRDIEIAGRSPERSAACLGLLLTSLDDLGCQVPAVELGDRGHDAVEQDAAGGLVDVLGHGHQGGSRCLQCEVDLHVVGSVAGQSVDLVDDEVVGRMLSDERQQLLEFRPVGAAGALAGVDELGDD